MSAPLVTCAFCGGLEAHYARGVGRRCYGKLRHGGLLDAYPAEHPTRGRPRESEPPREGAT